MDIIILAITAAIIVVILLTILYLSVRVVQQYRRLHTAQHRGPSPTPLGIGCG